MRPKILILLVIREKNVCDSISNNGVTKTSW